MTTLKPKKTPSCSLTATNDLRLLSDIKTKVRKLRRLNRLIASCETQMQNIRTLPYYTIFNREAERATDLSILQQQLNALIIKRRSLLA